MCGFQFFYFYFYVLLCAHVVPIRHFRQLWTNLVRLLEASCDAYTEPECAVVGLSPTFMDMAVTALNVGTISSKCCLLQCLPKTCIRHSVAHSQGYLVNPEWLDVREEVFFTRVTENQPSDRYRLISGHYQIANLNNLRGIFRP